MQSYPQTQPHDWTNPTRLLRDVQRSKRSTAEYLWGKVSRHVIGLDRRADMVPRFGIVWYG